MCGLISEGQYANLPQKDTDPGDISITCWHLPPDLQAWALAASSGGPSQPGSSAARSAEGLTCSPVHVPTCPRALPDGNGGLLLGPAVLRRLTSTPEGDTCTGRTGLPEREEGRDARALSAHGHRLLRPFMRAHPRQSRGQPQRTRLRVSLRNTRCPLTLCQPREMMGSPGPRRTSAGSSGKI